MKINQTEHKKVVRIPSLLYRELYLKGGDKLIATYCLLKSQKDVYGKFYAFTAKNNKKVEGLSILRKFTNISLHSLKKYVPMLLELNLCFYDKGGNFCVVGNKKLNDKYKSARETKLVPIELGVNITDTAVSSYFVRVHSNYKAQHRMIQQKKKRSVLQLQLKKVREGDDAYLSTKDYKKALRNEKNFKNETVTDRVTSSNDHFSVLKDGTSGRKQRGNYWKKKLVKKSLIVSKKKYKKMQKMTYADYRLCKPYIDNSHRLSWSNGFVMEQLSNTLEVNRSPIAYGQVGNSSFTLSAKNMLPCNSR